MPISLFKDDTTKNLFLALYEQNTTQAKTLLSTMTKQPTFPRGHSIWHAVCLKPNAELIEFMLKNKKFIDSINSLNDAKLHPLDCLPYIKPEEEGYDNLCTCVYLLISKGGAKTASPSTAESFETLRKNGETLWASTDDDKTPPTTAAGGPLETGIRKRR